MDESIRIDKYLWSVRLYKTRSMATEACRCGHVKMGGMPLKASHEVKIGEVYDISIEQLHKVVEVTALLGSRLGSRQVANYIKDRTPIEEYDRIKMVRQYAFEKRDRGAGRPTKRERRDIESFKYK